MRQEERWTQQRFDEARAGKRGWLNLGTGDFRSVDFGGASFLEIGEGSRLGTGVRLGEMVRIGRGSVIGEDCRIKGMATIGERCTFGEGACIGPCSKIGSRVRFEAGCEIGSGSEIGDLVELPERCLLMGCPADGRTLIKLTHGAQAMLIAFRAEDGTILTVMPGATRTLEEYEAYARALLDAQDERDQAEGRLRSATAAYIRARMDRPVS